MVAGSSLLLALAAVLVVRYLGLREAGETAAMLFTESHVWYAPLNIHYAVGVDGISVAMLLLSAVIVFTGTFASWRMKTQVKEYFLWFCLLSVGVFGFFISVDLFTMFMFYEVALIPMYLLIGVWGSGRKEYAAMKLTLMLMGGSALLLIGILGIYFGAGATTMNILEIAQLHNIPARAAVYLVPAGLRRVRRAGRAVPVPYVESRRPCLGPDGRVDAPCRGADEAGRLRLFPRGDVPDARSGARTELDIHHPDDDLGRLRRLRGLRADRPQVHQRLLVGVALRTGAVRHSDDEHHGRNGRVLQMLSHGLMTALFFALIGMIYGRTHTRDIRELSGLMKVMPFLAVGYVIAGLANLGLPGLSGFVAEMTIFNGAFMNDDTFHRVVTIIACTSIVITAVYILRVVGKILYGTCTNEPTSSCRTPRGTSGCRSSASSSPSPAWGLRRCG